MGMKTNLKKLGDAVVVTMDGKLDFEMQEPLRRNLEKLFDPTKADTAPKKIIFNLENLEFVGSSGISSFIQTLKEFSVQAELKPRYCNVKTEFRKVMKAFDEGDIFEFFDNEERAKKSFDN